MYAESFNGEKSREVSMGILKWIIVKQVSTAATKGIIRTVGQAVVDTTAGVYNEVDKHNKINDKRASVMQKQVQNTMIKPPDIEEFIGEHYLKARAALVQAGFEDISFVEIPDIKKGWLYNDGEVEEISIGGKTEIRRKDKIFPNTPVVISYHTFAKKNISPVMQQLPQPCQQNWAQQANKRVANVIEQDQPPLQTINGAGLVYCPRCGSVQSTSSRFCSSCGQQLQA